MGTQFYKCEAQVNLEEPVAIKWNAKILKNLLIYAGSLRPPPGGLGMTGILGILENCRVAKMIKLSYKSPPTYPAKQSLHDGGVGRHCGP